ncbi:ubiquitin-conjugating enzyme/RWD-like protein [Myxozyma melibiosi]|uniref:Ubiquitin-conjugating enzyme/RWD-like protein n=1 Tax=Myxozyma melibiosi TaxID=54550 RepID=A0ABR1F1L0_9ASCO
MSLASTRRLLKEFRAAQKSSSDSEEELVRIRPVSENDLLHWVGYIRGSKGTLYEGGRWNIDIQVPKTYPLHPPEIKFITPICHPNVNWKDGLVCLDILKGQWTAAWTLQSACMAILVLLSDPEPNSPLNVDIANLVRSGDEEAAASLVHYFTAKYAST